MNAPPPLNLAVTHESLRIAGRKVDAARRLEVRYPYTGELVATVPQATVAQVRDAIGAARARGNDLGCDRG